jgi:uncharacterized protein involved in exopolysaccharide biosynthesis
MTIVTTGRDPAAPSPPERPTGEEAAEEPVPTGRQSGDRPAPGTAGTATTSEPARTYRYPPDPVVAGEGDADPLNGVQVIIRPRRRRRLRVLERVLLTVLALALVALGAAAGHEVADRMPNLYAAHADVLYPLVQEQPTGFLRQDRNLSTQEVLLASRTVLEPVATQFGIPVEDLVEQLETEVVDESEVIRVQFRDPSRAQARKVLVAILARYIEVSNNPQRTALRAYLDAQLADVQARLVTARAAAAGETLGLTQAAQAEIDALVQREATLQSQIDEDQLAAIAGPAPQVTVPPYVEHDRVSPQPLLTVGGGALAGLVVAVVTVAVVARRLTRP